MNRASYSLTKARNEITCNLLLYIKVQTTPKKHQSLSKFTYARDSFQPINKKPESISSSKCRIPHTNTVKIRHKTTSQGMIYVKF